ncbi:MAG: RCC1 domain-containing protein [Steroidobacteraceae bacterium]
MRSHFIGALVACLLLTACGPGDPPAAVPISGSGGSGGSTGGTAGGGSVGGVAILSHNAGQDCMGCHKAGGTGKGVFTVAGTVYKSGGGAQTAATVTIFPQGSNTAQATMTVDGLGNFWTTQTVAALTPAAGQTLVQGVRAVIQPTGGTSAAMLGVISNGSCNACHSPTGGTARVTAQFVDMGGVHAASSNTGEGATPVVAAANPTPMLVQIAVSEDHACVARRDGAVLCWGSGEGYSPTPALMNLASGDARAALLPSGDSSMALVTAADVPGLAGVTFMQVSSAGDRSCGITTDDRVKCWEGTHASVDVPIS